MTNKIVANNAPEESIITSIADGPRPSEKFWMISSAVAAVIQAGNDRERIGRDRRMGDESEVA